MNFNQKVYEIVKKVPKGKVTTYGQIAEVLSQSGKSKYLARAVGTALHKNMDHEVPCHRVVDRAGRIAPNFAFDGADEQRRRLVVEGVKFIDPMHVDLAFVS